MKSRTFFIMQYAKHPKTGEVLMTEDQIKLGINHKGIKRWAYILHNQDVYTEEEEQNSPTETAEDGTVTILHKAGEKKGDHWHIALQCGYSIEIGVVAAWFGVPEQYVDVPKGLGCFYDCVKYLTHEDEKQQRMGKHRYPDECVRSNFDFRKELNEREERQLKYGKDLSPAEMMMYQVLYEGKTLKQCEQEDPILYMNNIEKLKNHRLEYIKRQKPPTNRINFYLYGRGGTGKDLMSRAIARLLFPQYEDDEDIFFIVGGDKVPFDGYDGQPVLIWSDRRAVGLIKALGGRENFFNVFETHPTKQRQNIKYGSVNLCNVVNIVNGQESYTEFLDGISGEYTDREGNLRKAEDKNQAYRRFPLIIPLHRDDFDLLINKGYFNDDSTKFEEYYQYMGIIGNMQKLIQVCGGNEQSEIYRKVSGKLLAPISERYKEIKKKHEAEDIDETEVMEWMEKQGYGTISDSSKGIPDPDDGSYESMII